MQDGFGSSTVFLELEELSEQCDSDDAPPDGDTLAKTLVRQGRLTSFQATALLKGKGKALRYGHFVVIERLGIGGMGVVYKAKHRRDGRIVAIKEISRQVSASESGRKRFFREVRSLSVFMRSIFFITLE